MNNNLERHNKHCHRQTDRTVVCQQLILLCVTITSGHANFCKGSCSTWVLQCYKNYKAATCYTTDSIFSNFYYSFDLYIVCHCKYPWRYSLFFRNTPKTIKQFWAGYSTSNIFFRGSVLTTGLCNPMSYSFIVKHEESINYFKIRQYVKSSKNPQITSSK